MSLASSRVSLIHRCSILRNEGELDSWGGKSASWADHLTDVPCRAWAAAGQMITAQTVEILSMMDVKVILPLGTDVVESDFVGDVTWRGDTMFDGPMEIQAILRFKDRIELALKRMH